MSRPLVAAAAAFASFAALATGTAATAREVAVNYADLDLDSAGGRDQLEARIHRAARTVCGDDRGLRPLSETARIAECVRNARNSARSAMAAKIGNTRIGG